MCILFVYTLLKVVNDYDLSVLSMSVMCFQKKVWMGVGGWCELHPSLFWIFGICLTLQIPLVSPEIPKYQNSFLIFPLEDVQHKSTCQRQASSHVQAMYSYTSADDIQLNFVEGDIIAVLGERKDGWQYGENIHTKRCVESGLYKLLFCYRFTG